MADTGFNSVGFSGSNASYFSLKTGANSISFSPNKSSYFGLKVGLNAIAMGSTISKGRLLLDSILFTSETTITISSAQGSYQLITSDGYFPIYPFYSDPTTIIQLVIEAQSIDYFGELTVTPSTPDVYDVELELITGMAIKTTAITVIPKIPASVQTPASVDSPFCYCECTDIEIVFTDEIGVDGLKNDKSSFLFRKYAPVDAVDFELWKNGAKVADITDSSYGDYYDFGSFATQPNYKAVILNWYLIQQVFGYGIYILKTKQVLLGQNQDVESRKFQLLPYSQYSAHGTVKIESYQTGRIINSAFDYTDLVEGGWYSSFRIEGNFGQKTPILEVDNYIDSEYNKKQIQDKIRIEYTLQSKLLPSSIADYFIYDSMLANEILISNYSLDSQEYQQISVVPALFEVTHPARSKKAVYVVKFEERRQDTIKRNY